MTRCQVGELNSRVDGILTARLAVILKSTRARPMDGDTAYRVSHHEPTDISGMEPYVFLEVSSAPPIPCWHLHTHGSCFLIMTSLGAPIIPARLALALTTCGSE